MSNENEMVVGHPNRNKRVQPGQRLASSDGRLCVVADGAGGTSRESGKSSSICTQVAERLFMAGTTTLDLLGNIVITANAELRDRVCRGEEVGATTFSGVHLTPDGRLLAISFGDSPIFLISGGQCVVQVRPAYRYDIIVKHGFVTEAEADSLFAALPWWLQQQLGVWLPQLLVVPNPYAYSIAPGDKVVLCTDGIAEAYSSQEIATLVAVTPPEEAVLKLVDGAATRGSADDLTCAVGVFGD